LEQIIGPPAGHAREPEFIAKLGIVLEEADEAVFWLELLLETSILDHKRLEPLLREANLLTSIFVSSLRTAKSA